MPKDEGLSTISDWLKALFSKAPYALLSVASLASTLLTFIPFKSASVRPVLIVVAALSFARANFKLFQSNQTQIADLEGDVRVQEGKIDKLERELARRDERGDSSR